MSPQCESPFQPQYFKGYHSSLISRYVSLYAVSPQSRTQQVSHVVLNIFWDLKDGRGVQLLPTPVNQLVTLKSNSLGPLHDSLFSNHRLMIHRHAYQQFTS